MHNESVTAETLRVLDEVKLKGYIKQEGNAISIYYRKMNHALAKFLTQTPVVPNDAVKCMEQLKRPSICLPLM